MKRLAFFLLLLMSVINVHAADKISKLVFFGDSLSDNGNLYGLTLHLVPKSPPYFEGRFTNGPTWAENVGNYYRDKQSAQYKIYAYGGATALAQLSSKAFVHMNLGLEVYKYLLDSMFQDKSHTLFTIWIGGNDYLFNANAEPETTTTKVVNQIIWAINELQTHGGKNFLILNLPDLSQIPKVRGTESAPALLNLTLLHNQKLADALIKLHEAHLDLNINTFDIYANLMDVLADPDKYNKKYNTNVTHLFEACWTGGVMLKKPYQGNTLANEIQHAMLASGTNYAETNDAQTLNHFIMQTPELAYTYQMGQAYTEGKVPCSNPDEYFFWDSIHPSAVAHKILGQILIEQLAQTIV